MSTIPIPAFYTGNSFPEITAFQEFFNYFRDSVYSIITIQFGIFFVILLFKRIKMVFKQGLQNILSPWYIFLAWISRCFCCFCGYTHRESTAKIVPEKAFFWPIYRQTFTFIYKKNKKQMYSLLFKTVSEALKQVVERTGAASAPPP